MRGSKGLYVRKMPSLVPVQVCLGLVLLLAPSLAGSWDRFGPGGPGSSIVTAGLATPPSDCYGGPPTLGAPVRTWSCTRSLRPMA